MTAQHPALTDPTYSRPGSSRGLLSVIQYRYVLSLLLRKGVVTRYYGSALGWAWSYVRPFMQFCMYYLVIGVLLGANRGMNFFPVYLFAGIIIVNLFNETLRNTTDAMVHNKALIRKIFLPREIFVVAATGGAVVHFLPQAAVLFVICLFLGWSFSLLHLAAFIAAVLIVAIFAMGLGLFFGAINVRYRDARNIVDLLLMFATWASPVLYTQAMVKSHAPDWLYHLYMLNPVTTGVELSHEAFWETIETADVSRPANLLINCGISAVIAIITLLLGQLVFRKLEGQFAQSL